MATRLAVTADTQFVTPDNTAFDIARKKARYGHRTWLVYRRRDGAYVTRLYTAAGIKAAMLATGTQGRFWWISGSSGTGNICRSWNYAVHLFKCARGWERRGYSAT